MLVDGKAFVGPVWNSVQSGQTGARGSKMRSGEGWGDKNARALALCDRRSMFPCSHKHPLQRKRQSPHTESIPPSAQSPLPLPPPSHHLNGPRDHRPPPLL